MPEINDDDTLASYVPDMDRSPWLDMRFLTALDGQMREPVTVDRDGYPTNWEMGYKPTPRDPRWLMVLTIVMTVMAALSIPIILIGS